MKKENGILTLEASISLTAFILFILFFLNFAKVYQAQNIVAYGAYETSKQVSIDNYMAETLVAFDIGALVAEIMELAAGTNELNDGEILLLKDGSIEDRVKTKFERVISASGKESANEYLLSVGVENGINGLDFQGTKLTDDEIVVSIKYKVKLMFPFMGIDSIEMEQHARSRLWNFIEWSN